MKNYPDKPNTKYYQHNYGSEIPMILGRWQWSSTFGSWSRLVLFYDGWNGFTYPTEGG